MALSWSFDYEKLEGMTHQERRISRWEETEATKKLVFQTGKQRMGGTLQNIVIRT
jgi:hypothetical protein